MKYYERYEFSQNGYKKLFNFNNWRVATLEYVEAIDSSDIDYLECHYETDEAFILIEGNCRMAFFKNNDPTSKEFQIIDLEPQRIYRVLKGVYHAHRISKDAKIVLVEEESTADYNSHRVYLSDEQRGVIR